MLPSPATAMQPTLNDYDGGSREDHFVHLSGVTWEDYRARIQPYELIQEQYQTIDESKMLPGIDLRQLVRFIDSPTTSQAMREYRKALTAGASEKAQ